MVRKTRAMTFSDLHIGAFNMLQCERIAKMMEDSQKSVLWITHEQRPEDRAEALALAMAKHGVGPMIVRTKPETVLYDTGFGREEIPKIQITVDDVLLSAMSKKMVANAAVGAKQVFRRPYEYNPGEFTRLTDAIHKASIETNEWEAIMHKTFGSKKPRLSKIVLYYRARLNKVSK